MVETLGEFMAGRQSIEDKTEKLLMPIVEKNNFELVDVEFVKEGADWYLRAYIDKEGGINIDDCELVSRALEAELDKEDFIEEGYILEVSSPGLTRPLKKEKDYKRNLGKLVEIHTFKPIEKRKEFVGTLQSYDDEKVVITEDEKEIAFSKKDISLIRQYFEW